MAYIDDILIFSKTFEEHVQHLDSVLTRLANANLMVNITKCFLVMPSFKILGFTSSKEGITPNEDKVKAILNYPLPATAKEVSSFLGMVSWCRRFIHHCASRSTHLRQLATASEFKMSAEAAAEFEDLKQAMAKAPVLKHPNFEKPFYVWTDASIVGYRSMLTQRESDIPN